MNDPRKHAKLSRQLFVDQILPVEPQQGVHWSITSTVNRPFNSKLLLTPEIAVYGINSLLTAC